MNQACCNKNCQASEQNLFYCCNSKLKYCLDCTSIHPCPNNCLDKKVLYKSKAKQQSSSKIICFYCKNIIKSQFQTLSCSHHICIYCIGQESIRKLMQGSWKYNDKERSKYIICKCSLSRPQNVTLKLQRYCFCCGNELSGKTIILRNQLSIHSDCRNIVTNRNILKYSLSVQLLQKMIYKCYVCSKLIDGFITLLGKDNDKETICQNCKDGKSNFKQNNLIEFDDNKTLRKQVMLSQRSIYQIQLDYNHPQNNQMLNQQKQHLCVLCNKFNQFEQMNLIQNQVIYCNQCIREQFSINNNIDLLKSQKQQLQHSQIPQISNASKHREIMEEKKQQLYCDNCGCQIENQMHDNEPTFKLCQKCVITEPKQAQIVNHQQNQKDNSCSNIKDKTMIIQSNENFKINYLLQNQQNLIGEQIEYLQCYNCHYFIQKNYTICSNLPNLRCVGCLLHYRLFNS